MKKKVLAFLSLCLAFVMLFALAGCGDGDEVTSGTASDGDTASGDGTSFGGGASGEYDGTYYVYENGRIDKDGILVIAGNNWSTETGNGTLGGACVVSGGQITLNYRVGGNEDIDGMLLYLGYQEGEEVELYKGTIGDGVITLTETMGESTKIVFYLDGIVPAGSEESESTAGGGEIFEESFPIEELESYSRLSAYVQLDVRGFGSIVLELNPNAAPLTVANFTGLVESGFYDGLTFHRIISGFMIQGGDPEGTGYGGSEQTIKGEFAINGWENPISHLRGVISMARGKNPDSASSQFFIVHEDSTFLDGSYAAFGRVVVGMEVVDAIAFVETNAGDFPLESVVIERALLLQRAT